MNPHNILLVLWPIWPLCYCSLASCANSGILAHTPAGIIVMNQSSLQTWYTPAQECMISKGSWPLNVSYDFVEKSCEDSAGKRSASLQSLHSGSRVRDVCCTEDLPLNDRGFDWVLSGHENGHSTPLVDLFISLSRRNMSLITVGDSTNGELYESLIAELMREGLKGTINRDVINGREWFHETMKKKLCFSSKTTDCVEAAFSWTPELSSTTNFPEIMHPVFVYQILLWYFDDSPEEITVTDLVVPQLAGDDHPSGVIIIANIGHHLDSLRGREDPSYLYSRLSLFLNWLHSLQQLNPKNIVFFRETTPSHFPSRKDQPENLDINGTYSYEKWLDSSYANYSYLLPNSWDQKMYRCNATVHDLRENSFVDDILNNWGASNTKVRILKVFNFLSPFYTLKYGHCGIKMRIDDLDCVHYCSFSPPMWIPVWKELLNQVQLSFYDLESVNLDTGKDRNKNDNEIKNTKRIENENLTNSIGSYYRKNISTSSATLTRILRNSFYPIEDVKILSSTINMMNLDQNPLFILYHGVVRFLPSWAYLISEVNIDKNHLNKSSIIHITPKELNKIPIGYMPIPSDGNIVKYDCHTNQKGNKYRTDNLEDRTKGDKKVKNKGSIKVNKGKKKEMKSEKEMENENEKDKCFSDGHHSLMWFIEGGLRRSIPSNWNSSRQLIEKKLLLKSIIVLPIKEVKRMPVGRPLIPPEGFLIRCDELNSGILRIENGEKRLIPDWDTFLALGFNHRRIMQLHPNDYERIPSGINFPKLEFVKK